MKLYIRHCERSEAISPFSALHRPVGWRTRRSASLREEGDCFGLRPRNDALGDFCDIIKEELRHPEVRRKGAKAMKKITSFLFIFIFVCMPLYCAEGTVPREKAASYPHSAVVEGIGIGSSLLKEAEIKQRLISKLGSDFVVIEVALYPQTDNPVEILPDQFVLRIPGKNLAFRPENPKVLAGMIQKDPKDGRDIRVVPHVGIGYESGGPVYDPNTRPYDRPGGYEDGRPGYDPNYGRRRGIYTSTGVGVMVGAGSPTSPLPEDRDMAEIELSEKSLPGGTIIKPVAGFLYFFVGKKIQKDRKVGYQLEYELRGKKVVLPL